MIKVLRQQDLHRQSETEKFFDLGNFNDVHRFRLPKKTKFGKFKARVAEELGVPNRATAVLVVSTKEEQDDETRRLHSR